VLSQVELGTIPMPSAARRSWGPSWRRMGVAEEARARGFPSPSFGGFAFVGVIF
jgi:hypothetical protein